MNGLILDYSITPFTLSVIQALLEGKSETIGTQPADIASNKLTEVPSLSGMVMYIVEMA